MSYVSVEILDPYETSATAVLYGNRNGISGTISGIKMTKGGDIYNINPDSDNGNDNNPIEPGPMTYVTISVTGVNDSTSKRGLTADGVSQLLIKAVTNKDGYVALSMTDGLGLTLKLDESYAANSSNIMRTKASTASTAGTYETTAILTAPEAFPSGSFPQRDFTVYATFAEDANDLGNSEIKASQVLTLHAAPVILIHGIFGQSESTFGKGDTSGIWPTLETAGLTPHPFNYVNSQGPNEVIAENQVSELANLIALITAALDSQGIVCRKADIVAHSMGGLMARRFLQADSFAKRNNPVRRIITVATPHRGTPIADVMLGENSDFVTALIRATIKTAVERYLEGEIPGRDAKSAWNDLKLGKQAAFGFHVGVPMYSIYGDVLNDRPDFLSDYANYYLYLYFRAGHDVCVSVTSAAADFSGYSIGHEGKDFWHSSICKQNTIGEEVLELLKGPVDRFKVFSDSAASAQTYEYTDYNYHAASAGDDTINYLVEDGINLTADPSVLNSNETVTLTARLNGTSASGDLFMAVQTANDNRIFMSLKPVNDEKDLFKAQINFASLDAGINGARCFAEGDDGLVYLSNSALFTVKPDLNAASVTGLELSDSLAAVYTHVNSAVSVGLYAKLSDGREFNVASPKMGTVWTASDPSIAEVTDTGLIKGLKVGSTTLTASYNGFSVDISVDVAAAYSSNDNSGAGSNNNSSGSGGCNSGLAGISELLALAMMIALLYTIQQKRKKD